MKQGWFYCLAVYLVSFCIVNLDRFWSGDTVMMNMFTICNILAVTVPPLYWLRSPNRYGASMGMAINMILIAFTNFLPTGFGWWTTASSYYNNWLLYLAGVILTLYAIGAAYLLSTKPKKEWKPGEKKPIR